jgi:hypothetical protein
MSIDGEAPWLGRQSSLFARWIAPLVVISSVVVGVLIVVMTHRPPPTLSAEELHTVFADQYLEFWYFDRVWTARSDERLDGDNADLWVGAHYAGHWWIENDSLCFEVTWGTGCWRVALGPGNRIYWYTLEGKYAGTITLRRVAGDSP